jgi:hypothetical protein
MNLNVVFQKELRVMHDLQLSGTLKWHILI